jgi:hypothetical protein
MRKYKVEGIEETEDQQTEHPRSRTIRNFSNQGSKRKTCEIDIPTPGIDRRIRFAPIFTNDTNEWLT